MPAPSIGTAVCEAIHAMKAREWGSSNSWRMTSRALIMLRRIQMLPRGCSASRSAAVGPCPIGRNRVAPRIAFTSSYSSTSRRYAAASFSE